MKSVAVYYAGIPKNNVKKEKKLVLSNFAQGVSTSDDTIDEIVTFDYKPTDLAVIQGWVHEHSQSFPHLRFRKLIIDQQRQNGKHTLAIDSNLFLYRDIENRNTYLRFSLDGIFPNTGCYFNNIVDPTRWEQIKQDLEIDLKPWTTSGNHILICLQRNGGWSMNGYDVMNWCLSTIEEIRKYSNRPIVIRAHPGDRNIKRHLKINLPGVSISSNKDILDDFKNAWATITYNSSPGVASAIEGIPVFVTDNDPKKSQAFDVCNTDLHMIESPEKPDRLLWIQKICMSHWKFEELRSGKAWKHIRNYL